MDGCQVKIQDGHTFREYTQDGQRIYHKSMGNDMCKLHKAVYYAVTLWGNRIINKLPSRHIRRWFYQMLGAKLGKDCFPSRRVEILLPKGLKLGDRVSVAWFVELDARGGIVVGHDTNISSHVKLITGSHDVNDPKFTADFLPIHIGHHCWIGTGAMILQGVRVGDGAVVAAGSVVTKDVEPWSVVAGIPAKKISTRHDNVDYHTGKTPMFY